MINVRMFSLGSSHVCCFLGTGVQSAKPWPSLGSSLTAPRAVTPWLPVPPLRAPGCALGWAGCCREVPPPAATPAFPQEQIWSRSEHRCPGRATLQCRGWQCPGSWAGSLPVPLLPQGPWVLCQWDTVGRRRGNSVLGLMATVWALLTEPLPSPTVPQFPSPPASPWACRALVPPAALRTQPDAPALPGAQPCASLPGAGLAPAPEALEGSQVMSDSEGDTFCDTLEQMEPEKVTEEALEALPSLPCTDISARHRQPGSLTKPAGTPLHLSVLRVTAGAWSLSQRGCRGASPGPHCCGAALVGHWGLLGLGQTSSSTGVPPPGLLYCHFCLRPAATGHVWHSRCHGEAWWIWWKEGGSPPLLPSHVWAPHSPQGCWSSVTSQARCWLSFTQSHTPSTPKNATTRTREGLHCCPGISLHALARGAGVSGPFSPIS